ncbi:Hym1p NDAI_0D04620 [Naumovozyma dairenensis CBS 421]|uniref:Protein HYM1 n=1 Tax=Naumovozyma dairenensis (strain ATCC 10597 / BCRC 20456 / CBS 421 / NBRC 0211 / NRRL Y-12639) TaxID=1071378 RepID=G0WAG4_NAUDC|nr:hypothetical protein NDAI_0D04620 [Naumovozyma dairenensis CBS 421]CCD24775.1 hypothetical protein NDAI_0D04620 [Naumovozyma dairenensis CBS 421]
MFKKYKNQDLDMAFWWKKNPKTSSDYVKLISNQLAKIAASSSSSTVLSTSSSQPNSTNAIAASNSSMNPSSSPNSTSATSDSNKKLQEECSKYLIGLKHFILADTDPHPSPEAIDELYTAMFRSDLFYDLILHIPDLEFEARKEVMIIFAICLNYSKDNKFVTVDYFIQQPKTINLMLKICESSLQQKRSASHDVFLVIGNMIIECIKYEQLCRIILKDPQLWNFFEFAKLANFEISTQSLQILNAVFTTHSKLVSKEFFNNSNNIINFIKRINKLMTHGNYVTKRQSTKLLASLIIQRNFNQLMNTYINAPESLKIIMNLMTDKSKNLQLEAFNCFKILIANPRKSKPILDILIKNREKLLKYFETFGLDNQDPVFLNEREFVIDRIENLPRIISANIDPSSSSTMANNPNINLMSSSPSSHNTTGILSPMNTANITNTTASLTTQTATPSSHKLANLSSHSRGGAAISNTSVANIINNNNSNVSENINSINHTSHTNHNHSSHNHGHTSQDSHLS